MQIRPKTCSGGKVTKLIEAKKEKKIFKKELKKFVVRIIMLLHTIFQRECVMKLVY